LSSAIEHIVILILFFFSLKYHFISNLTSVITSEQFSIEPFPFGSLRQVLLAFRFRAGGISVNASNDVLDQVPRRVRQGLPEHSKTHLNILLIKID
jgi:hypothetical protein